jgi:hypothetical protein
MGPVLSHLISALSHLISPKSILIFFCHAVLCLVSSLEICWQILYVPFIFHIPNIAHPSPLPYWMEFDYFCELTLNLLTSTMVAPPSNAIKWQMGFNSAFKGLIYVCYTIFWNAGTFLSDYMASHPRRQ